MALNILGIIIGILVSSLWIFIPLKKVPHEIRLKSGKYIASIVIGATLCTLVIALLEIKFDDITGIDLTNITSLKQAFIVSFLRAALIEEAIKFIFVKSRLRKYRPLGRLQYMLLAGTIGMGYGITEKLYFGSTEAMLFDAVFALHIMYQFIMGAVLYEADRTEAKNKRTLLNIEAFLVPYILHAVWDFILFGSILYVSEEMTVTSVAAVLVIILSAIGALAGEILVIVHIKKMNASEGIPSENAGTAESTDEMSTENGTENTL